MKEETLRKCADLCKPGVYGCEACDYRHREEDELSCQQILARDLAALEETDGKND